MVYKRHPILALAMILGVIGSLWALADRYRIETKNHNVQLVVDYQEVLDLAGASRHSVSNTLEQLKTVGVTSVAIQEQTVTDLVATGAMKISETDTGTKLECRDLDTFNRLKNSALVANIHYPVTSSSSAPIEVHIDANPGYVLAQPISLAEDAFGTVQHSGLSIIVRMMNHPGIHPEFVEATIANYRQNGIGIVMFSGDAVLGFRSGINDVANMFKNHGMAFGSIEFVKQKGDLRFAGAMLPNVIKVHSITAAEMSTLDRQSAVDRMVKAARERDVRLLYIRLFDLNGVEPLEQNLDYISAIDGGLRSNGLAINPAQPFDALNPPAFALSMVAVGIAAGITLLTLSLWNFSRAGTTVLFAISLLFCVVLALAPVVLAWKLLSLIAAIVFPILAVLSAIAESPESADSRPLPSKIGRAICRYITVIMIALAGGLSIASLLGRVEFMLRIDQFAGVKIAHLLPVLAITLLLAAGIAWEADTWKHQLTKARDRLSAFALHPVLIWQAVLAFVLMAMLWIVLVRSGNEAGAVVSGMELKFRSFLDAFLPIRPRTKEFLIGHPALFLAIAAAFGGRRNLAGLLLIIGTIGEVSLVNTFCHIHTPIALSLMRVVVGAVLGLAIGIVILYLSSFIARYGRKLLTDEDAQRTEVRVRQ